MTLCTAPSVQRPQMRERRPGRPPSGKRLALARALPGKVRSAARRSLDPCDNSNDSGLGFDHHTDPQHASALSDRLTWAAERAEVKRQRLDIKLENDDLNDSYSFPESIRTCKDSTSLIRTAPACSVPSLSISSSQGSSQGRAVPRCIPLINRHSPSSAPVTLTTQLSSTSRYMDITLDIIKQPEAQHRARYQTEGSRGAVKDRDGNGFPIVQLCGYHKPATLQVFIGTDVGKVAPHMFYQACRVSGKNSTPCTEKKIDGTIVIELQLDPTKDMLATCDCVGILKERNVDVEHRFPDQLGSRSKKKSTKCRMIFRTTITHDTGIQETLQVCSQPIVCTQPPGIPEISKKSLTACPATGGLELLAFGKNFLKDTRIYFQQLDEDRHVRWEQSVLPDKEYLQATHFCCMIPPFMRPDITEPVTVRLYVVSSGKMSEPHQFVYTPVNGAVPSVRVERLQPTPFAKLPWPHVSKQEHDLDMMPPPESNLVPLRRSSTSIPSTSEVHSPPARILKQELLDDNSQSSSMDLLEMRQERFRHLSESSLDVHQGDSNMSMINDNSIDMLRHNMDMINENSNMSLVNENSMEMMVRRNSMEQMGRMYDSSMDVNLSNSNLTAISEDSNCSTVMHQTVNDRLLPSLLKPMSHMEMSSSSLEDYKGIDLRMKMPMATVADLVHTNAPSMSTLQHFGVTEATTILPTQSAQSIENYLTTIESTNKLSTLPSAIQSMADISMKDKITQMINSDQTNPYSQKVMSSIVPSVSMMQTHLNALREQDQQPVYMTSQQQHLSDNNQNEAINIVAKSEAAAIAEQNLTEQTTITSAMTSTAPINTEKLDDFVNSTVEKHICSPQGNSVSSPKELRMSQPPEIIITTEDVMMNSQPSIMVSPGINATMASPTMSQHEISHNSPNISSDVILNSQISPSMMCRNTSAMSQDALLPTTTLNSMEPSLMQQSPTSSLLTTSNTKIHPSIPHIAGNTEAEKAILIKAAVDLFETQQKISQLDQTLSNKSNGFGVQFRPSKMDDNIIPVPVKEMVPSAGDKKNEDRMIPPVFATMSENELISIINPSCFDQGNNSLKF